MKDDVKQPPIKVTFYWMNMSSRTVAGGLLPVSTHQCLCLSARFTKILIPTPVHHAKPRRGETPLAESHAGLA